MESSSFYAAPQATLGPDPAAPPAGSVPPAALEELAASRVMLFTVGLVGALGCAAAVGMLAWLFARQGDGLRLVILVMAALFAAPAMLLTRVAAAIKALTKEPSAPQLVEVMRRLRDFWRLLGFTTAAALGVYVIVTFFMGIFLRST